MASDEVGSEVVPGVCQQCQWDVCPRKTSDSQYLHDENVDDIYKVGDQDDMCGYEEDSDGHTPEEHEKDVEENDGDDQGVNFSGDKGDICGDQHSDEDQKQSEDDDDDDDDDFSSDKADIYQEDRDQHIDEDPEQSDAAADNDNEDVDDDKRQKRIQFHYGWMLVKAAGLGHVNCVNACLAAGAYVNTHMNYDFTYEATPLFCAVHNGDVECVTTLIKAGADVNSRLLDQSTYLSSALSNCRNKDRISEHEKCVELLLEAGAKVTRRAVVYGAQDGTELCLKLLIQARADLSVLLLNAVRTSGAQQHKKVKLLINAGADVNFMDNQAGFKDYSTALCAAVDDTGFRCVKQLIEAGADLNIKDIDGNTALHYSHCYYNDEIRRKVRFIKVLLQAGIKVNVINKPRNQPNQWLPSVFKQKRQKRKGLNALMYCRELEKNKGEIPCDLEKASEEDVKQRFCYFWRPERNWNTK